MTVPLWEPGYPQSTGTRGVNYRWVGVPTATDVIIEVADNLSGSSFTGGGWTPIISFFTGSPQLPNGGAIDTSFPAGTQKYARIKQTVGLTTVTSAVAQVTYGIAGLAARAPTWDLGYPASSGPASVEYRWHSDGATTEIRIEVLPSLLGSWRAIATYTDGMHVPNGSLIDASFPAGSIMFARIRALVGTTYLYSALATVRYGVLAPPTGTPTWQPGYPQSVGANGVDYRWTDTGSPTEIAIEVSPYAIIGLWAAIQVFTDGGHVPTGAVVDTSYPAGTRLRARVRALVGGVHLYSDVVTVIYGLATPAVPPPILPPPAVAPPPPSALLLPPNWGSPVQIKRAWKTDVLTGENGAEQRVSLRDAPVESISYTATVLSQQDVLTLNRMLVTVPLGRVSMPRWPDATQLLSDLAPGGTSIACDTTDRAFVAGSYALVWRRATGLSEVRQIAAVSSGAIDITGDPATLAWAGNTDVEVVPIAPAWLALPLAHTSVGGVVADVHLAAEWEAYPPVLQGAAYSTPVSIAVASDAAPASNFNLNGSYIVLAAHVYDADGAEIPEAPVTWTTSDPSLCTVQPVGLFGHGCIVRRVSSSLVGTAVITASAGGSVTTTVNVI